VHAEVRAITNALRSNDVVGSTLYFTSVDEVGARLVSGAPYCTICSKFALETGVAFFVLEHDFGVVSYPSDVYNQLSFSHR
jgi:deoxycytidylate deaminase